MTVLSMNVFSWCLRIDCGRAFPPEALNCRVALVERAVDCGELLVASRKVADLERRRIPFGITAGLDRAKAGGRKLGCLRV